MTIRVLIVDDHAVVREGIRNVLAADPGLSVAGEAGGVSDAIVQARTLAPDVILLDITMPGQSGLEAVPLLLDAAPSARIMMLSVHDDPEYVLRSVHAGAHGYLRKDTTPAELRQAVHAVHEGQGFYSPSAARHLREALRSPAPESPRGSIDGLTGREKEVLVLVAEGLANKAIAARLGISVRTIEAHRDNLGRKLGVRTVAGLTRFAIDAGLIVNKPSR
jgi:two-component system nitrate/nitrite response regulator NarL